MRAGATLAATFLAAILIETIGAVDPLGGGPQLPSPRRIAATCTVWFVLGLAGSLGHTAARAAAQLSLLVLLTMLVVGPFGKKALTFLQGVSQL